MMKLSDMLRKELEREVQSDYEAYDSDKLKRISDDTGIGALGLLRFLEKRKHDTMTVDFFDRLFDRYRANIINPVKSNKIRSNSRL